jgi:DNA-binding response OmpR family regulator
MLSTRDILVIENNDQIRAIITETLDEEGYTVRGVSDRTAMYRALDSHPPDLLICDLDLDCGPGLTLITDIRAIRAAAVQLILLTTSTWIAQSLARDGYTFCLLKPFDLSDLLVNVAMSIHSPVPANGTFLSERAVAA